ncbi:THUMP domain-containing protein 1 [Geodia barretti]|uniref:THUMP domain-containing protein 1 n=1 Tax=Geodia barretti TaxID=519541 RepID=A0AA35RD84_GEOBA|nr:THUMP domain-containing protein 1 [Geodia barretti]
MVQRLQSSMEATTGSKKRKRSYYSLAPHSKRKKEELCPGLAGILISTSDHERLCVSEAYNLLNEYADQLYGPEPNGDDTPSSGDDVSLKLAQEVDKLRGSEEKPRRFQAVDTGTKHLVFVKCHPLVDPVLLVHHMLSSVKEAKEHKARFCQRFIPVSAVCHATDRDIQKCVSNVFAPHFYLEKSILKFAVVYKARNNQDVNREEIIKTLASLGNFCVSVVKTSTNSKGTISSQSWDYQEIKLKEH